MKTNMAYQLELQPDKAFPKLKRLTWKEVDCPLRETILHGVHPAQEYRSIYHLSTHLIDTLNREELKHGNLTGQGLTHDIYDPTYMATGRRLFSDVLPGTFKHIRDLVGFAEDGLGYEDMLQMVVEHLHKHWRQQTVQKLLERLHHSFPEQRSFIKARNSRVKLSGRRDIEGLDLARILRLEDFLPYEKLLLDEVLPFSTLRRESWLRNITDEEGRLRLLPQLRHVRVSTAKRSKNKAECVWQGVLQGEKLRLCPELDEKNEAAARGYARQWRCSGGELCFTLSLDKLEELYKAQELTVDFPAIDYPKETEAEEAQAVLPVEAMPRYRLGEYPTVAWSGEALRELLQGLDLPKSGDKAAMLGRITEYAARLYEQHKPNMNRHFSRKRYIRVEGGRGGTEPLPLLRKLGELQYLVLGAYLVLHLRGGVLLEPKHNNDTATVEQTIDAFLHGRITWTHSLLEIPK